MTRICILPRPESINLESGIGRIVHAQHKYLPALGIEFVGPEQAEVIAGHTQAFGLPRIDVAMIHGLYWNGDPGSGEYLPWHMEANQKIVETVRKARVITVPSAWVAESFLRDMRISPRVIPHGLELSEWSPGQPRGFVLWNKNRAGDVCDPRPAVRLAEAGVPLISTFAPPGIAVPNNFRSVGVLSQDRMRELLKSATAYLATTRETYGIGTLEALACGVPVLGFRWGGTSALIQHEVNGYLVAPGDLEGLRAGWEYIQAHWQTLSEDARASVEGCDWSVRIQPYADLFRELAGESVPAQAGTAVIIPCYNYGRYVQEAIESVLAQTRPAAEIVVVDDGSTDDTQKVLEHYAGRIKVISQSNQGVAAARNHGIIETHSPYIICLDADDRLDPRYLEVCAAALDADRGLGIAYTGLFLLHEDGHMSLNAWPPEFSWESMAVPAVPPASCIHTAAIFRRSLWERAGGYKQEYAPAEDTEFWVRGLSIGFTARRVTEEGLFHYRPHADSALRSKTFVPIDLFHPWMRDKKYPFAAPARVMPPVRSYGDPLVSVILTAAKGETDTLPLAIDSLLG